MILIILLDRTKIFWSSPSVITKITQNITGFRSSDMKFLTGPNPNFFILSSSPAHLAMTDIIYYNQINTYLTKSPGSRIVFTNLHHVCSLIYSQPLKWSLVQRLGTCNNSQPLYSWCRPMLVHMVKRNPHKLQTRSYFGMLPSYNAETSQMFCFVFVAKVISTEGSRFSVRKSC